MAGAFEEDKSPTFNTLFKVSQRIKKHFQAGPVVERYQVEVAKARKIITPPRICGLDATSDFVLPGMDYPIFCYEKKVYFC